MPELTAVQKAILDKVLSETQAEHGRPMSWLERMPDGAWAVHYFPDRFTRPLTFYQKDFWNWADTLAGDKKSRPRIECEPRGVGKSTNARAATVKLFATQTKRYCLYVCATDNQAQKHFNAIRSMMEDDRLLADYPQLMPAVQKHRPNVNSSWSSERLVTRTGQVVEFISLLGNARGFTTEEGRRPDWIVLDDIDDTKDSAHIVHKKLEILSTSIIPAQGEFTDWLMPQNLIHRDSICQQIFDQRADVLSDRIFVGPFPMLKWYDAERIPMNDGTGAMRWQITAGEVVDKAISTGYCEGLLNDMGKDAFDRECQQEVFKVNTENDFREWDEHYHVITESEFRRFFESHGERVWNEQTGRLQIPDRWTVGMGLDWGTTSEHPASCAMVARPPEVAPLTNSFFVFAETVLPEYPLRQGVEVPLVSPGRVADAVKRTLSEWNVSDSQIKLKVMSHEASAALNTMSIDLQPDLKLYFNKWKAARGSGVAQIQNYLEIDRSQAHPFREGLTGRPRLFCIVSDDQGKIMTGEYDRTYVAQPKDHRGMARLRFEMPLYNHRNSGQNKIDDDMVDALRGLANVFFTQADQKTKAEIIEERLESKGLDMGEIDQVGDKERRRQLMQIRMLEIESAVTKKPKPTNRRVGVSRFRGR